MKPNLKRKLKKLIFWLIILFGVLFSFRLIYGYTAKLDDSSSHSDFFENISNSKRNYASKEYKVNSNSNNPSPIKVDQKYEKIAEIKTKSSQFQKDEKSTRSKIEKYDAIIQFEQKSGNAGARNLSLAIGVPPGNFDSLYEELITIGGVQAKQITKKDKTNDYKELNAKKQSLEQIRTSLIELKTKGGKIEEYMGLENRILEIEQQLQDLGVSLGDFDNENEFCTVKFSIKEGKEVNISFIHRVKVALEWTIKMYLRIMVTLFFLSLFAYLVLLVIEKTRLLESIVNKKE